MGRYDPKYSDEQRQAIISAVLADGFTSPEAVERAAAGKLGLPAFEMPDATARGFVNRAKRQSDEAGAVQLEHDQPGEGIGLVDRSMAVLNDELRKIEEKQQAKDGILSVDDHERLRWTLRNLEEVDKVRTAIERRTRGRPTKPTTGVAEEQAESSSLIHEMLNDSHNGHNGNGAGQGTSEE